MRETSKASIRRIYEAGEHHCSIDWYDIFKGRVLDVGCGDDPLNTKHWPDIEHLVLFDTPQGDANKINEYAEPESFDCVHGSQVMEHLFNPWDFIRRCLNILKPGGFIVMTVPDFDLYEHGIFPSQYNGDHKTTWSLWRREGGPKHIYVPAFVKSLRELGHDVECRLIDTNYDYTKQDVDQTFVFDDMVECWIEIIIRKKL